MDLSYRRSHSKIEGCIFHVRVHKENHEMKKKRNGMKSPRVTYCEDCTDSSFLYAYMLHVWIKLFLHVLYRVNFITRLISNKSKRNYHGIQRVKRHQVFERPTSPRVECTRTILPCCCWLWCSRALRRSLSALVGLGIGTAPGNVPMLRELSERLRLLPPDAAKCDMLRLMLEALRGWLCCSVSVLSSVGRFLGCASWSSLDME